MKRRFGAFLMIILGVVLITTGLPRNGAVVGSAAPPTCGEVTNVGAVVICPEGTINITKVDVPPNGPPTPQATWSVDISTVNCNLPQGGGSETVTVPDKGTGSSTPLYVYTDITSNNKCVYTLSEEAVAGWSPSFNPPSPVTIPFDQTASQSHEDVTLTNTSTETPTPTPTPTQSSASPSPTPTATHHSTDPSPTPTHSASALPTSSTAPVTLPNTGPSAPIGASVYAGIGLCLLGLFLAVGGRRRRRRG